MSIYKLFFSATTTTKTTTLTTTTTTITTTITTSKKRNINDTTFFDFHKARSRKSFMSTAKRIQRSSIFSGAFPAMIWRIFAFPRDFARLIKSQNFYSNPTTTYSCELWTFFSFNCLLFLETFDILVSTGYPLDSATKTTEIINIDNDGSTCKDLEEYPLTIQGAVGFNMGSMPVICGGYDGSTYVNQCHRMESGKWQSFANLVQGYVLY